MKVKIQALFLYMVLLCLLISIEIHQINSELENWTSQPPLRPFEDDDENSIPGSMSEVPNKINENVAPTKISIPEGYAEYQASSNAKISTPTKTVKVISEKPDDRTSEEANSYSSKITSRPVTTQVFGDDMSTRELYAAKLEMDSNIFEMGSGSIPDNFNENASTVLVTEDNITATAHDLSISEVVLLIGVSFASFLVILSAFIILAITLVVVVRYVYVQPDCNIISVIQ